jgi:putative redox protein
MVNIRIRRSPDAQHTIGTDPSGNEVMMYLPEQAGGAATGIRPMQMLLLGMGGCSAVDVLLILKKQRQQVDDFWVDIEADRQADQEPSLWRVARLHFHFVGPVAPEKAENAVRLSMGKYCSVSETLRQSGAELTWEVSVQPTAQ